jgi:hypothetical protein
MKQTFGYIDETTFKSDNKNEFTGTGLFLSDNSRDNDFLEEVISKLDQRRSNDEKYFLKETKNIDSKIFHAATDSNNTRNCFLETINEKLNGHFRYSLKETYARKNNDILQKLSMDLTCLKIFEDFYDVSLFIEKSNVLSDNYINKWIEKLYSKIEKSIYYTPTIPAFFPRLTIKLDDKGNAGLQVVDYLIWSFHRSIGEKKDKYWLNKLNFTYYDHIKDNENSELGGNHHLNKTLAKPQLYYPTNIDYEDIDESLSNTFERIEKTIISLETEINDTRISHLKSQIERANKTIKNGERTIDSIRLISSTFIRVFDNLSIYNKCIEAKQWNQILYTRKIASLLLQDLNNIATVRSIDYLMKNKNDG